MKKRAKNFIDTLMCVLFPRRCALCGSVTEIDKYICDDCKNAKRPSGKVCKKCAHSPDNCECKGKIYDYKELCAAYYFNGSIATGIVRFKNSGFTELKTAFAHEMSKCIKERYADIHFDCITYVPLHKSRLKERGYNQAKLLAQEISKELDIPLDDLLIKVRNTKSQRSINQNERKGNLRAAFDLALDKDVKDKTILLIDDVKTTGSTLNECATTLRAYDAKAVYTAVIAAAKDNKNKTK